MGALDLSRYRLMSAALFDEACRRTGANNQQLASHLRIELQRDTLNRQSVGAWRKGDQAVPADAYLAVLKLAGSWHIDLVATMAVREPAIARDVLPTKSRPDGLALSSWLRTLGLMSSSQADAYNAILVTEEADEK